MKYLIMKQLFPIKYVQLFIYRLNPHCTLNCIFYNLHKWTFSQNYVHLSLSQVVGQNSPPVSRERPPTIPLKESVTVLAKLETCSWYGGTWGRCPWCECFWCDLSGSGCSGSCVSLWCWSLFVCWCGLIGFAWHISYCHEKKFVVHLDFNFINSMRCDSIRTANAVTAINKSIAFIDEVILFLLFTKQQNLTCLIDSQPLYTVELRQCNNHTTTFEQMPHVLHDYCSREICLVDRKIRVSIK